MSSNNHWGHAAHVVQHLLQGEAGKNAMKAVLTTTAAAAPVVVAGAVAAAPLVALGLGAYALYRLFKS